MTGVGAAKRRGALILAGIASLALPAYAASPSVDALGKLERGRWQVRELDGATPPASLCLGDPALLLRFEHRGDRSCSAEVLASGSMTTTVQYTCRGRGFGHSQLRVETPRSVRVDSQGFSNGRPFSYRLEARRTGAC
jgi:hypothetical protein